MEKNNKPRHKKPNHNKPSNGNSASKGAAIRAHRRNQENATKLANQYTTAQAEDDTKPRRANVIDSSPNLKIIPLGGMDGGGSKNMILVEYQNEAVIMDCGIDLGVDLPGINYGVVDTTYLEKIRHKIKAYLITHGHLDHIGGLPHIVPKFPAPIYGGEFTIGMVEKIFDNYGVALPDNFKLETVVMNESTHEKLKIGSFFVEFVRITHSIPGSTCIVLDTPVGKVMNTGDFRLDPTPLDHEKTDTDRLEEIAKDGLLVLMSDSTTAERLGRTPSESILEQSFVDIFESAPGRVFVALFSSNMNRIQMIVNAAVKHGRKVAFDGRSMMTVLELAVKQGLMRIPRGQVVSMTTAASLPDEQVLVVCTGSQAEPNSALQRMSEGQHKNVNFKSRDTVILSSTPIPETGNDKLIGDMVDNLIRKGVHVFRHATHDLDGCGPLHVSGHASLDEYGEMIAMMKPKYFIPIYGAFRAKQYHVEEAVRRGVPRERTINAENGDVIEIDRNSMKVNDKVPCGTVLVDQTGAVVNNVVIKDRLMLAEDGLVTVVLTLDKKSGNLMTSPDIISRGFVYLRDSEELVNGLRNEMKRAAQQRFKRVDLDRFKQEIKDHITHYLYEHTQRSPIVIPVVNVIGSKPGEASRTVSSNSDSKPNGASPEQVAAEQKRRFEEMRARLLGQDPRVD
jgi:ribonuclease J